MPPWRGAGILPAESHFIRAPSVRTSSGSGSAGMWLHLTSVPAPPGNGIGFSDRAAGSLAVDTLHFSPKFLLFFTNPVFFPLPGQIWKSKLQGALSSLFPGCDVPPLPACTGPPRPPILQRRVPRLLSATCLFGRGCLLPQHGTARRTRLENRRLTQAGRKGRDPSGEECQPAEKPLSQTCGMTSFSKSPFLQSSNQSRFMEATPGCGAFNV